MGPNDVRRQWADRSGEFSPEYYAYYGPNETSETIHQILEDAVDPTASVLELGCGSGRHLSHLRDNGFENVHGIDINADSFEVMQEAYPELAASGTFYAAAIEDIVEEFDDGQFDVVYSIETLQHIHPDDAWVFEELARCTDDLLITVENEGADDNQTSGPDVNDSEYDFPLYYRDWNDIFTQFGLSQRDVTHEDPDTLRVFERQDS
ncbi:hypothetical protein C453_09558 [Haloferax elongans ATCC BAA-1513]|uniref:Methyltransferase domain-containing protein n=1 Tax=Haloferax elongans ATCC BAA-1513 TaxID=1230453 RepID=M0HQP3_HALEO|nr:class I SAM-dependent methyltransferase [Haloferax elongans]ELZ86053.1 hypothetical protein C453_09558 [Haloferax elongans ATCC BAA-1513]